MNLYANALYNISPQESFRRHLKSEAEVFLFDFGRCYSAINLYTNVLQSTCPQECFRAFRSQTLLQDQSEKCISEVSKIDPKLTTVL